jgi:hypothetical protein
MLAAAPAAFPQQAGWVSLFNGKDLTGWKVGANAGTWSVKDGAIVASGPVSHLFYDGPVGNHNFKNFEFKVDVMTTAGSNGGIYFHTEYQESSWPLKGFEVQVNNTASDPIKSGSLYHVQDIGADVIKGVAEDGKWFTEHIIVQGNTVTVKVGDKQVVQWTQPAGWNGSRDFALRKIGSGTIAFQGHDPRSIVHYKNIQIKLLP